MQPRVYTLHPAAGSLRSGTRDVRQGWTRVNPPKLVGSALDRMGTTAGVVVCSMCDSVACTYTGSFS
jgi:hypothetical protein